MHCDIIVDSSSNNNKSFCFIDNLYVNSILNFEYKFYDYHQLASSAIHLMKRSLIETKHFDLSLFSKFLYLIDDEIEDVND